MNIALPVLLLCLFSLSFWLLSDSKVKIWVKSLLIVCFSLFVVIFYKSTTSFLGWGAPPREIPKIISIRSVVIKEPNKVNKEAGAIWLLIEQPMIEYNEPILKIFAHNVKNSEPRLFALPYSRKLHEQLAQGEERSVVGRTQKGQIVRGNLVKGFGQPGNKDGKGKGSESQEQDFTFYDLKPSYFQEK